MMKKKIYKKKKKSIYKKDKKKVIFYKSKACTFVGQ